MARSKRANIHYVNNKEFSQAVVDYVKQLNEAKQTEQSLPIVPDYIASCFLKIAEGLSHKSNFIRYTYREEMVMALVFCSFCYSCFITKVDAIPSSARTDMILPSFFFIDFFRCSVARS